VGVAVLGIGNELMADDGVGVHAVRRLREEMTEPRVELIEAGTALADALDLVPDGAHVVAVDAAEGGGEPGAVYRVGLAELASPEGVSLHERSLPQAFAAAELGGARFGEVIVLGVEPSVIEFGETLSPPVEAKLPAIIDAVRAEVARLLG
jgi:hydrogenase maturation protease